MSESSGGPGPRGKVERLIDKYELANVGDELVDRWTSPNSEEQLGLRELARLFNIRLVEARMNTGDAGLMDATVESYYDALSGEEGSSGTQVQVRRTLEQEGIDVEALEREFVSRQAIHTYLSKTREASKPNSASSLSRSAVRETVDRLVARTNQVISSRLFRLRKAEKITLGDFRVIVDVQVYCSDCGTQQSVSELLNSGACECS